MGGMVLPFAATKWRLTSLGWHFSEGLVRWMERQALVSTKKLTLVHLSVMWKPLPGGGA